MGYNMTHCNCPVCGANAEYDSDSDTVYCQSCIRRKNEKRRKEEARAQENETITRHNSRLKITRCHS